MPAISRLLKPPRSLFVGLMNEFRRIFENLPWMGVHNSLTSPQQSTYCGWIEPAISLV